MDSIPSPPLGLDLDETRQPAIESAVFITWAASLVVVGLRFTARKLSGSGFWWDDWLILPSVALSTASTWVTYSMMVRSGLGLHTWSAPQPLQATRNYLGLFIVELLYTTEMMLVKFSILVFYWRIFHVPSIKIPILIISFIVLGWAIGQVVSILVQCQPIAAIWDVTITNKTCFNTYAFFYGAAIPSIITDFACLILPMPYVWRLKMSQAQKFGLTLLFALGGFVVGVSIIRLGYLASQDLTSFDFFWNMSNGHMWTIVELNTAIISACLPSMRPIWTWSRRNISLSQYGLLSRETSTVNSSDAFGSQTTAMNNMRISAR